VDEFVFGSLGLGGIGFVNLVDFGDERALFFVGVADGGEAVPEGLCVSRGLGAGKIHMGVVFLRR
jgi:hypothetical protein